MNKTLSTILLKVVRIEHIIYCATNCKVEFFLHKAYYEWARERYEKYVKNVLTPKYDW